MIVDSLLGGLEDAGSTAARAEAAGFDVLITADQNIEHQQNLTGRKLALVVLGSNIWPIVCEHKAEIAARTAAATVRPWSETPFQLPL